MTSNQLLELLKREILAAQQTDEDGNVPSVLGALELIELYKIQVQDETINDFLNNYKTLVPDHDARTIAADRVSREYANTKNPLVKCR